MSLPYKQLLKEKIASIFSFLRSTFKDIDKDIYNQLNEEYEEEMLILAGMIPNDWIGGFYDSLAMVLDLACCVDVAKLADAVEKHNKARLWFSIDSYTIFMNQCVLGKGWGRQAEIATGNICKKFKPIFNAVDKLFSNPSGVLKRIATIASETEENSNILGNLM